MESTNSNSDQQQPAALTVEQALLQAVTHHKAGQLRDAERLYRAILQAQPSHPDANHNLGVLAVQVKQVANSLPYFKVALEANPNQGQYWLSYADALLETGQGADALSVIRNAIERGHTTPTIQALRQKAEAATAGPHATDRSVKKDKAHTSKRSPKSKLLPHSEQNAVIALFNAGHYVELESKTRQLAKQYPNSGFVWKVLGVSRQMQGKDAVSALQKAVELLPDDANAYFNLGIALQTLGRLDQAVASYRQALGIKSDYDEASNNLGNALKDLGRLDEAVASYRKSLEIRPDFAEGHYNLGNALAGLRQFDDAIASYRRALEINPDYYKAHNNLGNVLTSLRQFDDAAANLRLALQIKPDFAEAHNNLGNVLKDLGRFDNAAASYRRALEAKSDFAEAHNNLGNVLKDLGQLGDAVASYHRALEIHPDFAEAHSNLGNALTDLGRLDEAVVSYRRTLEITPDCAEANYNLSNALRDLGQLDEAVASYHRALVINPDYAEAHSNLGTVLKDLGQFDAALASYRRALEIRPGFAEAHYNFAVGLQDLGQFDEAVASYGRALRIKPDYVKAHNNLGNALTGLGRFVEAATNLRRALEINPDFAEAHNNLGNALKSLGQLDDAVANYRRALEMKPDFAEAHSNLGNVLKDLGQLDDAVASHRRALEINPDFADAYNNLGNVLKDLGQLDGAIANYSRALEIKPDFTDAHSNLLFTHNYRSDQTTTASLADARHFGYQVAKHVLPYADWYNVPEPSRRLRIGFVSADLRAHPVGYFLESILAALTSHTSTQLELVAYANSFDTDAVTERIKAHCNGWHSVRGLSDEHLAKKIRDDGIDILIDLSGHTAHNRLTMFARKPAPIQVSWLGYFATTGVEAVDYLIADHWVVPKAEEAHFTEIIVRLPETYLCFTAPDLDVKINALPALETNAITFGCFNHLAKMNPAVAALWAKVLMAVPGSRLFLKTKQLNDVTARQSVMDRFAIHGIGPERLILEGSAPRAELLAAYQRVDIALDPFPYPGGTTSIEALWMGVPVLSLAGDRFLSHIGESILHNAGLPDWIAIDADDYVARAVAHARDLPRLSNLRSRLRQQVLKSPLFDAPRFAGHFEAALRGMWVQWCNQQPQQKL